MILRAPPGWYAFASDPDRMFQLSTVSYVAAPPAEPRPKDAVISGKSYELIVSLPSTTVVLTYGGGEDSDGDVAAEKARDAEAGRLNRALQDLHQVRYQVQL